MSPNITLVVVAAILVGTGVYLLLARSVVRALIGFLLLPVVGIGAFVLHIMAAVSESKGQPYRYPFTLRLIS